MPSFAIPLWLLLAAASKPDPLSPPPHGRPAEAAPASEPSEEQAAPAKSASATVGKATKGSSTAKVAATPRESGKSPSAAPSIVEAPEEEVIGEALPKSKSSRKAGRRAPVEERMEQPERRNVWSADRYAAVVPPGLTLAALRSQLGKTSASDPSTPNPEKSNSPDQTLTDINKAREALRQETARLESLLKAAGNCGLVGGLESGSSSASLSANPLRETSGEQLDSVSKAMKGMKPEQAAAMIARLDRGLAAEILRRMKATDAGAILGILKPELAADLTTEIATRKPMKKAAAK